MLGERDHLSTAVGWVGVDGDVFKRCQFRQTLTDCLLGDPQVSGQLRLAAARGANR